MFGSNNKVKRSFRQTYRDFRGEGGTNAASGTRVSTSTSSDNSSPTEQQAAAAKLSAAKLSANATSGFGSSNTKSKPSMLRIRSAFSGKKTSKLLSPVRRNLQHRSPRNSGYRSPLAVSAASDNSKSNNKNNRESRIAAASPLSPAGEQKLRMMPKIAAYRTKGYLTAAQERNLFAQLEQKQGNPFDNSAVKEVEQQLEVFKSMSFAVGNSNSIDSTQHLGASSLKNSSSSNPLSKYGSRMVATTVPADQKQFLRNFLQKENARTASMKNSNSNSSIDEKNNASQGASKTSVFDRAVQKDNQQQQGFEQKTSNFNQGFIPSKSTDLNQQPNSLFDQAEAEAEEEESFDDPPDQPYSEIPHNDRVILSSTDVFDKLDNDFVENLFIEMCFYARLGFTQPPTCLRCLYMEAMEGMDEDIDCQNWAIWRKDANVVLHPNSMNDNLFVVQCQAARRLVEGEEVQDHTWDTIKRQVVQKER